MRVLVQRVSQASVAIDGEIIGEIGPGLLLLAGITHDDTEREIDILAAKVANLRLFADAATGRMNRSALDLLASNEPVSLLVVSQFTLYADTRQGRRPSYTKAAPPELAGPAIDRFAAALRDLGLAVATGRFGAKMAVSLINDGPVTLWLDTADLRP